MASKNSGFKVMVTYALGQVDLSILDIQFILKN